MATIQHKQYMTQLKEQPQMAVSGKRQMINQKLADLPNYEWLCGTLYQSLYAMAANMQDPKQAFELENQAELSSNSTIESITNKGASTTARYKPYVIHNSADRLRDSPILTKSKCTGNASAEEQLNQAEPKTYPVTTNKRPVADQAGLYAMTSIQWLSDQIAARKFKLHFLHLFIHHPATDDYVSAILDMTNAYINYGRTYFKLALEQTIQQSALPWDCITHANMESDLDVLAHLSDCCSFLRNGDSF